jgi:predicted HicB family RNase H-like nuclease
MTNVRRPSISKSIKSSMMRPMNRQSHQYGLQKEGNAHIVQFSEEQLEILENSRKNISSQHKMKRNNGISQQQKSKTS